jgi:hypothetical protein
MAATGSKQPDLLMLGFTFHMWFSDALLAELYRYSDADGDPRVRATLVSRFLVRLSTMAQVGHVERIGSGQGVRWRLAETDSRD